MPAGLQHVKYTVCHCEPVLRLVWQSPGTSENPNRTCRGRCPHRPVSYNATIMLKPPRSFRRWFLRRQFLVPARKLIRSRLKGRCRKAAPLRIPRPLRQNRIKTFRLAIGSYVGGACGAGFIRGDNPRFLWQYKWDAPCPAQRFGLHIRR